MPTSIALQPAEMNLAELNPEQSTRIRNLLDLSADDMSLDADELIDGIAGAIERARAAGFAEARGQDTKALSLNTKYAMLVDADQHEVLKRIVGTDAATISCKELISRLARDPAIKASLRAEGPEGERIMASLRTEELIKEHNKKFPASAI